VNHHASDAFRACVHTKYRMACHQFDRLHEAAGSRCQICGTPESELCGSPCSRRLQIDHEKKLGYWAVRGLLCVRCNVRLGLGRLAGPEVDCYLANPWYRSLPFAHLVEPEEDCGPVLDLELAMDLVRRAAELFAAARKGGSARARSERLDLVDAVRTAYRSGGRQCDIAAATGIWRPEDVLSAIRERRTQPKLPL
jgi:hypothetical protein